jgi:hypothetical protein
VAMRAGPPSGCGRCCNWYRPSSSVAEPRVV